MERFWPNIGGAEILGSKLLLALRERGYDFIVVTRQDDPDSPHEEEYGGVSLYRFPFLTVLTGGNAGQVMESRQQVAKLKRTFAPDLVHIYLVGISCLFHLGTADAHPTPLLVTLHGALQNQAVGRGTLLGQTLRSANWVTCCSAAVLTQARQLLPEIIPRSSLIYNSRDVPPLLPKPLPFATPYVLCLGRLIPDKGFDLALTAFASLVDRFPHAHLVIAGDGPTRPELERQAATLGVTDVVDFVGWVPPERVPELMNTATVVVVPSREEGFGLVALEAALMARPVVATRVGGLPEVVVHQQTGLLVEPDDSATLAEAIALLLAHPETAAQMGEAARHRAQELFSWDRCVDAYAALYRTLTKEAGHGESGRSAASQ